MSTETGQDHVPSSLHDHFFKTIFSDPANTESFLRAALPPTLVKQMDFSTLTSLPTHFVDPRLAESESDVLFSIRVSNHSAFVYVLFEHQSKVDPWMLFRLLCYMVRIWQLFLKHNPKAKKLPVILPVVLYHGVRPWTAATSFHHLLDIDESVHKGIGCYIPNFSMMLEDVTTWNDRDLEARVSNATVQLALMLFRDGRKNLSAHTLLRRSQKWMNLIAQQPRGREQLTQILYYLLSVCRTMHERQLRQALASTAAMMHTEAVQEVMMSVAEQLRIEGRKEGLAQAKQLQKEARLEGERTLVLKMVKLKFRVVPELTLQRIHSASARELERWAARLLTAESLDEVFAKSTR